MTREILEVGKLVDSLRKLNPSATFELTPDGTYILCDADVETLALPVPFYYNDKNGITNKHKTESGNYIAITVERLYR